MQKTLDGIFGAMNARRSISECQLVSCMRIERQEGRPNDGVRSGREGALVSPRTVLTRKFTLTLLIPSLMAPLFSTGNI